MGLQGPAGQPYDRRPWDGVAGHRRSACSAAANTEGGPGPDRLYLLWRQWGGRLQLVPLVGWAGPAHYCDLPGDLRCSHYNRLTIQCNLT